MSFHLLHVHGEHEPPCCLTYFYRLLRTLMCLSDSGTIRALVLKPEPKCVICPGRQAEDERAVSVASLVKLETTLDRYSHNSQVHLLRTGTPSPRPGLLLSICANKIVAGLIETLALASWG